MAMFITALVEVLPMRLFSEAEMRALYAQHTAETGQVFEEGALVEAYRHFRSPIISSGAEVPGAKTVLSMEYGEEETGDKT